MSKTKKQEDLERLVEELMKDQPSRTRVRQLTHALGIPYSTDQVTLMSSVLQSANAVYLQGQSRKQLER